MADNIKTVQAIYGCFGSGDIPGLLGHFADNIQWEWETEDQGIPWLKPRQGRENIGKFFETLGEHIELTHFEPTAFMSNDEFVVALCRAKGKHKTSGKTFEELEAHLWGFNQDGKADRFRHYVDTIKHKAILP